MIQKICILLLFGHLMNILIKVNNLMKQWFISGGYSFFVENKVKTG